MEESNSISYNPETINNGTKSNTLAACFCLNLRILRTYAPRFISKTTKYISFIGPKHTEESTQSFQGIISNFIFQWLLIKSKIVIASNT